MKTLVWLAAIAVGLVLYETIGERFRDRAAEVACSRHAAEMSWELVEWEGPGYKPWKMPGRCEFVDPRSGRTVRVSTRRIDRDATFYSLVVAGSAISVVGIALALVVGNSLTGALD